MSPSVDNLVLVKDRVPRNGRGIDNLLAQLGQYLRDQKNVQKIVIEASRSYLYFERLAPREEAPSETTMTWQSAIRQVAMDEQAWSTAMSSPAMYLHEMFKTVTQNGYEVCQVLVGPNSQLYKWADVPRRANRLFGVPISKDDAIPDDVVIVCGAATREADPEEVAYSVKGTMT